MPAGEDAAPSTPTKLGRYELITRIGQGGMAEVQLALQRGPAGFEKLVVVKLVHDRLASEKAFVDMLLDEARVAALLKHPNVVDIYDLGEVDGRYFIAMEYLDGEPLLAVLRAGRDGKRLDVDSTARLIADTADGLGAAHDLRSIAGKPLELVHHDVSLGNIVVLYDGQVKLVDFGVAKAQRTPAARATIQGKFGYMAPEKLRGEDGDRRSDIFSLGVVLWEALTLRRLFKGTTDDETTEQVLTADIPRPSQMNPDVPEHYDAIVLKALAREPAERYQTAQALAADLEAVLLKQGYGRKNDAIARYMQDTFKAHIEARQKLLQEVVQKGTASDDLLAAAFVQAPLVQATGAERNDFSLRLHRRGLPLAPPKDAPHGTPTEPTPTPARTTASSSRSVLRPAKPPRVMKPRPEPAVEPAGSDDDHEQFEVSTPVPLAPEGDDGGEPVPIAEGEDSIAMVPDQDAARRRRLVTGIAIACALVLVAIVATLIGRGGDNRAPAPADAARVATVVPVDAPIDVAPEPAIDAALEPAIDAAAPDAAPAPAHVAPPSPKHPPTPPPKPATPAKPTKPPPAPPPPPPPSDTTADGLERRAAQAYARGDTRAALDDLRRAQRLDAGYAPAWRTLGLVYERLGEYAQARIAYVRYLQLAPSAPDAATIRQRLDHLGR